MWDNTSYGTDIQATNNSTSSLGTSQEEIKTLRQKSNLSSSQEENTFQIFSVVKHQKYDWSIIKSKKPEYFLKNN